MILSFVGYLEMSNSNPQMEYFSKMVKYRFFKNAFLRIRSVQQREHIFVENDNRKSLSLHHELCNYVIWGGGRLLMAMEIQEFSSFSGNGLLAIRLWNRIYLQNSNKYS